MSAVAMGRTVIFKGMRTVAALTTAVVVASMRCGIYSDCSKGTGTDSLTDTVDAMADVAILFAMAAEQLSRTSTYQCTLCHVTTVVRVIIIVASFLSDVDHAVIAAVILLTIAAATTTSLGDGIIRAQLTSGARLVILADSTVAVVIVRVLVGLRAAHDIIFGFTGASIRSAGFTNKYGLFSSGNCGSRGLLHSFQRIHGSGVWMIDIGM
jgi:hypothetical protein